MHARAIGIEDARDLDVQPILPMVIEEQCLSAALALIITRTGPDWVHIAPIFLGLRMDIGVAVNLAGGSLQDARLQALGEPQHIDRAMHAGLQCLHRVVLVMDGRCRAGKVVDLIYFDIKREGHIMADQFEVRVIQQLFDIGLVAGEEIIGAEHLMPCFQQGIA